MSKILSNVDGLFTSIYNRLYKFDSKGGKRKRLNYYLVYTVLFVVAILAVYSVFYLNGKSFIWAESTKDGLVQHFNSLTYLGKMLREYAKNILAGNFAFPMWDSSIGYGADTITTLHYYALGDPLCLLSVFVPASKTEILYTALIILRLYLAGIAFSAYSLKMNRGRLGSVIGSLCYVFCGYAAYASIRHPYFTNPMIYLPLLLIGVEHIFEKRRPYLFIIMVALSAISNFYFFYMLCALVAIYAVIRFFDYYKEKYVRNLFLVFFKFLGFALIGVMIAGFMLLPNVLALSSSYRASVSKLFEPFYYLSYYEGFLPSFISIQPSDKWTIMGYASLVFLAVVLLFAERKKHRSLKIGFVVTTIILLIPLLGKIMHGMSYVSNRWVWGYSMLVCFIAATVVPSLLNVTRKTLMIITGAVVIVGAYLFIFTKTSSKGAIISSVVLFITALLIYDIYRINISYKAKSYVKFVSKLILVFVTMLSVCVNAKFLYSSNTQNYLGVFNDKGMALEDLVDTTHAKAASYVEDDSGFYRFDENRISNKVMRNSAVLNENHSVSSFYSLTNGNIFQYMLETANNIYCDSIIDGLDNRTMLETLAGVKYFVTTESGKITKPFGFDSKAKTRKSVENYKVYQNSNALGLGYTYDKYISRSDYENMTAVERQQALMQGVVLDDDTDFVESAEPTYNHQTVPYAIEEDENIVVENGKFTVKKAGSEITLKFNGKTSCETYLYFHNLEFESVDPVSIYSDDEWEELSEYEQKQRETSKKYWTHEGRASLDCKCDDVSNYAYVCNPYFQWYAGKKDYIINFVYSNEARDTITIKFSQQGYYTFDEMSVVCQPMDKYISQASKLGENQLENIVTDTNTISGDITVDKDKILCLAVPYSSGWTAYVDGKKAEVKRANTMSMGLELTEGSHKIRFEYQTPGLKTGALATCSGLGVFAVLIILLEIYYRNKSRKSRKIKN